MPNKNISGRIQSTLNKRREVIRIFIIAAVLAVGVNLTTSGIVNILPNEDNYQLWIGIIVIIISILYLGYLLISERRSEISYTSAVIFSNENNRPIVIPRYDFSEELSKVLMLHLQRTNR